MNSHSTSHKIAFLGMGLMGSRMSKRLLDAGFQLAVWNRTATACLPLLDAGATPFSLPENISQPDIIMLCLADDLAVNHVVQQLLPLLRAGQIIIDFSSLSVDMTQQLAARVAVKEVQWIDAPVSGGVMGAEQGTLVVFAGGDQATINNLQSVFAALAQRVTYMGKNGTGQATKICNQLIVAATSTLISEAVALASRAGVDTTLLAPALAGGFADSKPLQILAPRMATLSFTPVQWKVQTLAKDLSNAVKLASAHQLSIPVAAMALTQLEKYQAKGHYEDDLSSIITLHQHHTDSINQG